MSSPSQPTEPAGRLGVELTTTAFATVVIMASGIVTGLLVARTLGPDGRGELTASTIWPSTILYAGTFGLAEATVYFAARRREIADDIFATTQTMALVLGAVLTAVGWILLPIVLGHHSEAVQHQARIYLVLFALPCLGSLCACAWLQGAGHSNAFNASRTTVHVVTAVTMAALAAAGFASVRSYMGAMLLGNAAAWFAAITAWFAFRSRLGRVVAALTPQLLSYGGRVQFGTWSAAANVRLDQLMLSSLALSAPLGLYVVAVTYSTLITTIPTTAAMVMLPRVIRDCGIGRGGTTLTIWYRRLLWATVAAGICFWLASGILLPLLFGGAFAGSVPLVSILIPASCLLGMNQLLAAGFRAHNLPGVASRAELVGLIVTVPLLFVLLPRFGAYGAAVTSLCAYSLSAAYLLKNARPLAADWRAFWLPTHSDWHLISQMARSTGAFSQLP